MAVRLLFRQIQISEYSNHRVADESNEIQYCIRNSLRRRLDFASHAVCLWLGYVCWRLVCTGVGVIGWLYRCWCIKCLGIFEYPKITRLLSFKNSEITVAMKAFPVFVNMLKDRIFKIPGVYDSIFNPVLITDRIKAIATNANHRGVIILF